MGERFNIYCDESCHLEHDRASVMVLGAVWCPAKAVHEINKAVRSLKKRQGLSSAWEAKWTKISPARVDIYLALIEFFFDTADLHFRGVLIPDKNALDHAVFDQSHDDWYYKMMFTMIEPIIDPQAEHCIYLDIKDTQSEGKKDKLERVLRNAQYDGAGEIIRRVQQIRSHESEIMQLTDLMIGAIAFHNRSQGGDLKDRPLNSGKLEVIRKIQAKSGKTLARTTWLQEKKLNLLCWQPKQENRYRVQ